MQHIFALLAPKETRTSRSTAMRIALGRLYVARRALVVRDRYDVAAELSDPTVVAIHYTRQTLDHLVDGAPPPEDPPQSVAAAPAFTEMLETISATLELAVARLDDEDLS